jgi:hypothetical protein
MKSQAFALLCLALGAPACRSTYQPGGPIGTRNMWAAKEIHQASLHQAILAQSTFYPYHFVAGASTLNELGWRDLQVLAEHFVAHGGTLSVRRGGAPDELYNERVKGVQDALAAAGVEAGRVTIVDAPPGGPGTTSERMLEVLESMRKELQTEDASSSSQSSSSSSSSGTATTSSPTSGGM